MIDYIKAKKVLITLGLIFLVKAFIILFFVENNGWEPDSYAHFNEINTVYRNFPENLAIGIGVWSKPLYTFIFGFIPIIFGAETLWIIQILNSLILTFVSFIVYKILLKHKVSENLSYFSIFISSFSFLLFQSSLTGLTEPIFALFLILGIYFAKVERFYLTSIFLGIALLGRIEGLFFLGIFNLWLIYFFKDSIREKWIYIFKNWIIGIVPVFIWNLIGFLDTGRILYIFDDGYPVTQNFYGTGDWLFYFRGLFLHELIIFGLSLLAIIYTIYTFKKEKKTYEILYLSLFFGFFATQVVFWRYGLFGSAGLLRYFISIMPIGIILGIPVLEKIMNNANFSKLQSHLIMIAAFSLQIFIMLAHLIGVGPIDTKWLKVEQKEFKTAGNWIEENIDKDVQIIYDRPAIIYFASRDLSNVNNLNNYKQGNFSSGDIIVWTVAWGADVYNIGLESLQNDLNLSFVKNFNEVVYIFEVI